MAWLIIQCTSQLVNGLFFFQVLVLQRVLFVNCDRLWLPWLEWPSGILRCRWRRDVLSDIEPTRSILDLGPNESYHNFLTLIQLDSGHGFLASPVIVRYTNAPHQIFIVWCDDFHCLWSCCTWFFGIMLFGILMLPFTSRIEYCNNQHPTVHLMLQNKHSHEYQYSSLADTVW